MVQRLGSAHYLGEALKLPSLTADDALCYRNITNVVKNAPLLQYSAPIEGEVFVSGAIPELLMPFMSSEDREFFDKWYPDEGGHSLGQLALLSAAQTARPDLNLSPNDQKDSKITRLHEIAGLLANYSEGGHQFIASTVFTIMAYGELETKIFYTEMSRILMKLGEIELARYFGYTARQEGGHLGYQFSRAAEINNNLPNWQKIIQAKLIEYVLFNPVGVSSGDTERKIGFAAVSNMISEDRGVAVALQLAELANDMNPFIKPTSTFALKRYEQCQKILAATRAKPTLYLDRFLS